MVNKDLLTSLEEPSAEARIGNSYPNPFASVTNIPLEIKQRGSIKVEILDIRGTSVKTLVSKVFEPGTATIQWDGTDAKGNKLPAGIYLCRFISENYTETKQLMFIKD
jgi:flagellar hook assembly protein FlgD